MRCAVGVLIALTTLAMGANAQISAADLQVPAPTSGPVNTPAKSPAADASPAPSIPRQLSLDSAEQILLQRNLSITAAKYGVDFARAQLIVAGLKPNPTITFGAEQFDFGHPFRDLVTTNSNTAANRVYTFRWDQVIERGHKRELRTEAAEAQLRSAEAQVLDATRQQLFQLRQSFYNAVLARENLRVADENLYLINSTEQLIKLHVEAGDTAEWELIKFQANEVQYKKDQVSAALSYQQSVRDLLNLLGAEPSSVVTLAPAASTGQVPQAISNAPIEVIGQLAAPSIELNLSQLEQQALYSRPDLLAAQRAVDAAEKNWRLALALRHRDVDVAGEYQREGGENTFGVTVSIPVFVHNNHSAEISEAAAQLQQAKTLFQQVKLQTITDVDKAYRAYEISDQLMRIYSGETLTKAEDSFHIAGASYKEGATSLLELQDAQRTYNQTRLSYNQASYDHRMAIYQLELATGQRLLK